MTNNQPYESIGEAPACDAPRRPWLIGINLSARRAVAFKPRCKSWNCPACAEINARLWGARTWFGVQTIQAEGRAIYFLTLTSHENLSPEGTIKVFPQAWKTLRQRAVRKAGLFSYLMVPEKHKDGRMHAHVLETFGAGERWWKDNARAVGLGYMVDEQAVEEAENAAFYVVKYIGKGTQESHWPAGFRRVRVSKDWPPLPQDNIEGWSWHLLEAKYHLAGEIERIQESGFDLQILDHQTAWIYARAVNNEGEIPQ